MAGAARGEVTGEHGGLGERQGEGARDEIRMYGRAGLAEAPTPVTERAFDEYHLYTLPRPPYYESIRTNAAYFTVCNTKIWAMLEFRNSEKSQLGMPLPKGKVKVYRRDTDGRNEFIGEDAVDHTPKDETVRLYTGNAFDIVGERRQTNFRLDTSGRWADESFEIKVRNHKKEAVEVRVVEHMYRWIQWQVAVKSMTSAKKDARTIEFRPTIPPGGEAVITYTVHYSW